MPTPSSGESQDEFMGRCMAFPDMQQYPPDQRAAICHSKWEEKSAAEDKAFTGTLIIKSWQEELVEGEHADISVFTSEIVDDEGDVVLGDGVDWSTWNKLGKPIMFSHDTKASSLVGHGMWVKQNGKKWIGKSKYKEEFYPLVRELKGKSISGMIEKAHRATPEEKEKFGPRTKRVVDAVSIREVSICVLPVNPASVQLAMSKGLKLDAGMLMRWAMRYPKLKTQQFV